MAAGRSEFRIVDRIGEPEQLVAHYIDRRDEPIACFVAPTSKALVLGSSQDSTHVQQDVLSHMDAQLCRRRSGGSAVIVAPAQQIWLDVFVPTSHYLFDHDVCHATWWLGELWRTSLIACGVDESDLSVHHAGLKSSTYSGTVCFLGQGPGEVLVGGKKLVGISQRRDRTGAWFFATAMETFSSEEFADLFAIDGAARQELVDECATSVTTFDELNLSAELLRQALVENLAKLTAAQD